MEDRDRRGGNGPSMKPATPDARIRSSWLAGIFVVIGLIAMGLSFVDVGAGFATPHDPGPWLLPRILALALIAGGVTLVVLDRRKSPAGESGGDAGFVAVRPILELLGMTAVYIAALPWSGFLITTTLFVGLLLWRLKVAWWRAMVAALALTLAAHGLFAWLFKVPLPPGAWN